MAHRLKAMGLKKYAEGFKVTLHPEALDEPKTWKAGHNIFVCSMSDLFHPEVPDEFIEKVIRTIEETPQHRYQLLTKRAERMEAFFRNRQVPANAWLGVTVECKDTISRIDSLRCIAGASVRFLSCEPLLEDLGELNLKGIDWIIAGGESGPKARPMQPEWLSNLQEQSRKQKVAFFFKQWGTWGPDGVKRSKHANGKMLNGRIVQQMPRERKRTKRKV